MHLFYKIYILRRVEFSEGRLFNFEALFSINWRHYDPEDLPELSLTIFLPNNGIFTFTHF